MSRILLSMTTIRTWLRCGEKITLSNISFLNVQPPNLLFHLPFKVLSSFLTSFVYEPFKIKYFSFFSIVNSATLFSLLFILFFFVFF